MDLYAAAEKVASGQIRIAGILNLSEDSFSDGGQFNSPAKARRQLQMLDQWSDVIDVGASSSNPKAKVLAPAQEIERVDWIFEACKDLGISRERISVDSFQPHVQQHAIKKGAGVINDIRGFADSGTMEQLKNYQGELVVMHSMQSNEGAVADTKTRDFATVWQHLTDFFDERVDRLVRAGVRREQLILDPGMGFFLSSDAMVSYAVLGRIAKIKQRYGLPVYVSVSRKSFLATKFDLPPAERLAPTVMMELAAIANGADWIRTHEPQQLRSAAESLLCLRQGCESA